MSEDKTAATPQTEKKGTSWEEMLPTVLKPKCGWGNGIEIQFFLRMLSIEEEQTYAKRFVEIGDDPNSLQKTYEIIVDGLAAFSVQMPVIHNLIENTSTVVATEGAFTEVIRERFAQRTPGNERLAHQLMAKYRNRLAPDVSFL